MTAPWVEKDLSKYAGGYMLMEQDGKDPYRYVMSKLVLTLSGKAWAATYSSGITDANGETSKTSAELSGVVVNDQGFRANAVAVRKGWTGFLPDTFAGAFAIKYPPNNAKGPVERGLLLNGEKFFVKLGGDQ